MTKWLSILLFVFILSTASHMASADPASDQIALECKKKAQTTADTHACMSAEMAGVRKEFEEKTKAARALAKDIDLTAPKYKIAEKFEQSEKAFEQYMNAQCSYAAATNRGGTFSSIEEGACKMELMRQRSKMIELQ